MQDQNKSIRLTAAIVFAGDGEVVLRARRQLEDLIVEAGLKAVFFKTTSSRLKVIEVEQPDTINGGGFGETPATSSTKGAW